MEENAASEIREVLALLIKCTDYAVEHIYDFIHSLDDCQSN